MGVEADDGEGVETIRYERLTDEMIDDGFNTDGGDLEVIYCHIFKVEVLFEENLAVEEDAHFCLRQPPWVRYMPKEAGILVPTA